MLSALPNVVTLYAIGCGIVFSFLFPHYAETKRPCRRNLGVLLTASLFWIVAFPAAWVKVWAKKWTKFGRR